MRMLTLPGCLAVFSMPLALASDGPADLAGVVVARSGDPVAGARIEVFERCDGCVAFVAQRLAVSETDGSGAFVFPELERDWVVLHVFAEGFAAREVPILELPCLPIRIELGTGTRLRGKVRDAASGEAVGGASVTIVSEIREAAGPLWSGATDASGGYETGALDPGRYVVVIGGAGHLSVEVSRQIGVSAGPVEVTDLQAGSPATLRILDEDGAPLPHARIALDSPEIVRQHGITDDDGEVALVRDPLVAEYDLFVWADGGTWSQHATLDGNDTGRVVQRQRGVVVSGRVVDEVGRPVPGADLDLDDESAVSDEHGHFALGHVEPGARQIWVYADSHVCLDDSIDLDVPEGGRDDVSIVLATGDAVAGVVRDADGAPIVDAVVHVWSKHPVRTGSDGRFRAVTGALSVPNTYAEASARGFVTNTVPLAREMTIVMRRAGATIAGRVLDSRTGRPVAFAPIYLHERRSDGSFSLDDVLHWDDSATYTRADGTFVANSIASGTYAVESNMHAKEGWFWSASVPVVSTGERAGSNVELRIGPVAKVRLRATRDGVPVTSFEVVLLRTSQPEWLMSGWHWPFPSDASGVATHHNVPAGLTTFRVTVDDASIDVTFDVRPGEEQTFDVEVPRRAPGPPLDDRPNVR